jgi:transposase
MVYTIRQGGYSMPWKVISQMETKIAFTKDWNAGHFSITDLSHKYDVSRPTIYKWLKRYKRYGIEGLHEKSRAPKRCHHRI